MSSVRWLVAGFITSLVFFFLLGYVAVGTGAAHPLVDSHQHADSSELHTDTSAAISIDDDIESDFVRLVADIDSDGNADWRIIYRQTLDSDEEIQAFEELQDDIADQPDEYLGPFEERIQRLADSAREETDREMAVHNFTIQTERDVQFQTEFGLVVFSFEWEGFATADDDTIVAGDAIEQLFLDEDEQLQFGWPAGYQLDLVSPEPTRSEQQRVFWDGRLDFGENEPRVVLVPETDEPADTDEITDDPDDTDDTVEDDGMGSPLVLGGIAVVVLAALALVAFFRLRGQTESPPRSDLETATETKEDSGPPPELLSNEEQVLQLLERHGGRMKQKQIPEEFGWSSAKTSQVVSDMRDDEQLDSFRIGRENVLVLPDTDIAAGMDEKTDSNADDETES